MNKVVSIRSLTQRGVLVSNRVLKLHGKQLPISKNAEKTSSQLKNSVSSGDQQQKERRGLSSVFYSFLEMRTWRKHMKKGKENDAGFGGTR